jgi:hypothetical protein
MIRVGTRSRADWAAGGDPRSTTTRTVLVWTSAILVGQDGWSWRRRREEGYGDALEMVVFFWAARRRAWGWSSVILFLEAGVLDEGEPFLFDRVDELDRFGFLEAFAALWSGEGLAPLHGRITTPPCGKDDSDFRVQGSASGAVAAFVSAGSAGVLAGWGSAGVGVVVVERHVSFGCMNARIGRRSWIVLFVGLL